MRNNLLALFESADVIKHRSCFRTEERWANRSIQLSSYQSRKLRRSSATAGHNLVGLRLLGKLKLGVWVIPGSQRANLSKNISERILKQVAHRVSLPKNVVRFTLECSTNVLYYENRDGEVFEHFPTAKPSATVLAVARDLFESVLLPDVSSSRCSRLATHLLRRFATICKEGARHG